MGRVGGAPAHPAQGIVRWRLGVAERGTKACRLLDAQTWSCRPRSTAGEKHVMSHPRSFRVGPAVLLATFWLCACGDELGVTPDGSRPRADAGIDVSSRVDASVDDVADSGVELSTDAGADVASDRICGGASLAVTGRAPDVVILFDRSCSMSRRWDARGSVVPATAANFASGPEDPNGRWYVAREAVRALVRRYPRDIAHRRRKLHDTNSDLELQIERRNDG